MKNLMLFFLVVMTIQVPAQVAEVPEAISPLLIGEKIPEGTLKTMGGKTIETSSLWKERRTILIIYRGGWCPFCNTHLSEVGQAQTELRDLGYEIVAISPDAPAQLSKSMETHKLVYSLYSDEGCTFIKAMGLAFKAPERYSKKLGEYSDGTNKELLLPVPSLFIIDGEGQIMFEYINPNYKVRISKTLLLSVASALAEKM